MLEEMLESQMRCQKEATAAISSQDSSDPNGVVSGHCSYPLDLGAADTQMQDHHNFAAELDVIVCEDSASRKLKQKFLRLQTEESPKIVMLNNEFVKQQSSKLLSPEYPSSIISI
ncbi:hypothetical protein DFJ77DRAFT_441561 [Powellomyces hirtus]|nr:hypothetical protein DFJ77DRAFT_441561 [Powellomyces hirtus]